MKVALIDNLIMPESRSLGSLDVHPHLGLLALAAVATANGHQVTIYDPKRLVRSGDLPYDATLYQRVADDVLAIGADAVGFTALGCSFLFAANVAGLLRNKLPDLPLLLGGPHATMLHREILEAFPQFDVIVRYEADETFPAVLDNLSTRRFDFIPGLSWRATSSMLRFTEGKPKIDDLDSLPIGAYDLYPIETLGLSLLRIEAGRGCPFMCTFCSTAGFFQRSFRLKSADRLVREMDILNRKYGCKDFKLDHDMFTVNKRKVREFCEAVAGRGYRWNVSARVDCVDAELVSQMAASGCVGLYFGIETGSERMQEICRKKLDLGLVEPIVAHANSLGMETTTSFITGYPQEEETDQDGTLEMIGRCMKVPSCMPQLHVLAPEPGTPLFDEFGASIRYDGYCGPYNSGLLAEGDETLVRENSRIFQTYYYYPGSMPRRDHIFASEIVALLRQLGSVACAHIAETYPSGLARLVKDFRGHVRKTDLDAVIPLCADLIDFLSLCYGENHPIASLARYALAMTNAKPSPEPYPADLERNGSYVRAADVHVLPGMHDCEAVLRRLRTDSRTSLNDFHGELGAYVIKGGGASSVAYWVEQGVGDIIGLFETPQIAARVARQIGESCGDEASAWNLIESLIDRRVIVASGSRVEVAARQC